MRTEDRVTGRRAGAPVETIRRGRPSCLRGARPFWIGLAVLLLAIGAWVGPARAQMPDIHQMSGIPRPDTSVPDGTIVVRVVRGSFANNAVDQPVTLKSETKSKTIKTDAQGHATFPAFPPGTIVQASTTLDGEQLTSQKFPVPGRGGAILLLVGKAPTGAGGDTGAATNAVPGTVMFGGQSRVIIDPGDGDVQLFYLLDIINNESTPVLPPSPLILDMPAEGQGTALLQGSTAKATVNGNRVIVQGPFSPGETMLQVGTVLPYYTGSLTITGKFPADLQQLAVVARRIGDLKLSSPQIANTREVPDRGQVYVAGVGPEIKAGQTFTLTLTGLPFHSRFPIHLALGLAILIGVIGLWMIVTARRATGNESRVRRLTEQRERLFEDLVRLEQQHAAGAITGERHAAKRADLMARLERVYRQIEDETSTGDQGMAA